MDIAKYSAYGTGRELEVSVNVHASTKYRKNQFQFEKGQ